MSVLVRKGNGERLIPDEKMTEFLEMGYSVINSKGEVIVEAVPSTVPQYKALVNRLQKENESLKDQIATLEKEKAALEELLNQEKQKPEKGKKTK